MTIRTEVLCWHWSMTGLGRFALLSSLGTTHTLYIPMLCLPKCTKIAGSGQPRIRLTRTITGEDLSAFVLSCTFCGQNTKYITDRLASSLAIPLFSARVTEQVISVEDLFSIYRPISDSTHPAVRRCNWAFLEFLTKWRPVVRECDVNYFHRILVQLSLGPLELKRVTATTLAFAALGYTCERICFANLKLVFEVYIDSLIHLSSRTLERLLLPPVPSKHICLSRVQVTPLQLICQPSVVMPYNRLLRQFDCDSRSFLLVAFTDEEGDKLTDKRALDRVEETLASGLNLLGQSFKFLTASASQVRERSALFVSTGLHDIDWIRRALIPNSRNMPAAQLLSRLGMFSTSDCYVRDLQLTEVYFLEDKKAADEDHWVIIHNINQ